MPDNRQDTQGEPTPKPALANGLRVKRRAITPQKERQLYLDLIRVVACFFVIVNHTNSRIFLSLSPSLTWFFSLAYFFMSKVAVPLFVLCSGAVLLHKEEPYKKVLLRALRVLCTLLLFSFIYYIRPIGSFRDIAGFDFLGFFPRVLSAPITNAYWYLYMYLGLLLMLPILRKLVLNLKERDYLYFFLISQCFLGVWPILAHYFPSLEYSRHFSMPLFGAYVTLFLLGHFIHNTDILKLKKLRAPAFLLPFLMLLFQVVATYFEYRRDPSDFLFFDKVYYFPVAASSICLFALARHFVPKYSFGFNAQNLIKNLGLLTFGIYLVSDYLILELDWVYYALERRMHVLPAMLLFELLIFVLGVLLAAALRLIPGVKRLV